MVYWAMEYFQVLAIIIEMLQESSKDGHKFRTYGKPVMALLARYVPL